MYGMNGVLEVFRQSTNHGPWSIDADMETDKDNQMHRSIKSTDFIDWDGT